MSWSPAGPDLILITILKEHSNMIMKQKPTGKFYSIKTILCTVFIVLGFTTTSIAQLSLSWTATNAVGADNYFHMLGTPEWLNCDMYTDMSSGSIGSSVIAMVWDEDQSGTPVCSLGVYDAASGTRHAIEIAQDAKHPDVIISDYRGQPAGSLKVVVIYEEHPTGSTVRVVYDEYVISGMMGYTGTPTLATSGTNNNILSDIANDAYNPHIDGYMEEYYFSTTNYYWGSGNTYEPLTQLAATWTEANTTSGNQEIYTISFAVGAGTLPSSNYVVDGDWSDVGVVHIPQAGSLGDDIAYISYVDALGELKVVDYDYGINATGSSVTLENSVTIVANPRIDALNVQDPSSNNLSWMAVAQVDNGGVNQVRSYEPTGTPITLNDYATQAPLSTTTPMYEGHRPSVATGPGPDGKSPGVSTEYGNQQYIQSFRIAPGEMQALDRDLSTNAATSIWNGYDDINFDALDNSSVFGSVILSAVASSSNCGVGHAAAWHNFAWDGSFPKTKTHVIAFKYNTSNNMTFKPTSVTNTAKEGEDLTAYPNPANYQVTVHGLKADATYIMMDISGKVLKTGNITPANSDIDVSAMPAGVYIFNITEGDNFNRLKFIKQ